MDKSFVNEAFSGIGTESKPKKISFRGTSNFEWFFLIFGALPLYLPFIFLMGETGLSARDPIYWYFWINATVSSPHVWSTYARLSRKMNEGKLSKWWGLPLYAAILGALGLATKQGYFLVAMTAVNVWQSFHYCRQVFGVSKLVGGKGPADERAIQLASYAYHFAMPLFILGRWDVLYTVWGGKPSTTIIPMQMSTTIMGFCWALAGLGMIAGLWSEAIRYRKSENEYNPARLVTLFVYYGIHIFGFLSVSYFQRGFFAVTIFHAVQYLGIVWFLERKAATAKGEKAADKGQIAPALPALASFGIFWVVLFIVGYTLENYVMMGTNAWWPLLASVALAAVSAHHYSVDSVMWRRNVGV